MESGFPLFALSDPDQMIGPTGVKLREDSRPLEQLKGIGDEREWVVVLDSDVMPW